MIAKIHKRIKSLLHTYQIRIINQLATYIKHIYTRYMLAERVAELRKARGWSVAELARQSNLSHAAINKVESGEVETPRLSTLQALADALEVDLNELTEPVEKPPPTPADLSRILREMGLPNAERQSILTIVGSLLPQTEEELEAEADAQVRADDRRLDRFEKPARKTVKSSPKQGKKDKK